jgi:hypothetical protein
MDDVKPRSSDAEGIRIDSASVEGNILEEFNSKQPIKPIRYNQQATSFIVPAFGPHKEKVIRLEDTDCPYKKLIFSIIYTAFYRTFVLDDLSKSRKRELHGYVHIVTDYLNEYDFENGKEINFFKEFEASRINTDKVKQGSTGLQNLLKWLKTAYEFDHFATDGAWQTNFIDSALDIRSLGKNTDVEQTTLTDWFAYSTWLRDDDVGVGHDLYSRLASPKALITSFITTVTVQLNEVQSAKNALIEFFKANNVKPSDFQLISKKADEIRGKFTREQYKAINTALNNLRELYHKRADVIEADKGVGDGYLKLAIQFVIRECVKDRYFELIKSRFFANKRLLIATKSNGTQHLFYQTSFQEAFFSIRFLNELAVYAQSRNDHNIDKPKTVGEQTIFTWLMAYQTVQPSDINKLKLKDFRFVRRNNGQITHIDLEYFKGRANSIHQVRTLETRSLLGTVVLNYIDDFANTSKDDWEKKLIRKTDTGTTAITKMFESCGHEIKDSIDKNLKKEKVSMVFIESMLKILRNGIRHHSRKQNLRDYRKTCELRVQKSCFGLTAIKNSSVHSRSDTFTPTQLINYHSHTDEVERKYYHSESNLEWQNRSGLITRAVMNDMTVNLFRASDDERAAFNSEFTRALEMINAKKNDTLARLKLITGKADGQINDLGIVKKPSSAEADASDVIYLLDTPETVVKLLHYRAEAERLHHLLVTSAPEFLLFTVLPTTEWIEELFDKKSFSKSSTEHGQALYKNFKKHLSPLFQNQIR